MAALVGIRTRGRRAGAFLMVVGLMAVMFSTFAPLAGAVGPTSGQSKICNQAQDAAQYAACTAHGYVDWSIDASGDFVMAISPVGGYGWDTTDVRVCMPYAGPQQGADCTGADSAVSVPFTLSDASGCDGNFTITVAEATIQQQSDPFSWALHLSPCGEGIQTGTDEAFGTTSRTPTTTTTTQATTTTFPTTTTTTLPTTTTTQATTTTTKATTTTTRGEGTTTTTQPGGFCCVENPTTTTTPQPPATTTTALVLGTTIVNNPTTTTTAAPEVIGEQITQPTSAVLGAQLARTGDDTRSMVFVAGLALLLGGAAILAGDKLSTRSVE